MLKFQSIKSNHFRALLVAGAVSLPLAGCMTTADPWGEGSLAYTADEMHPIGSHKACGQDWPDLALDTSNHFAPNHGCAVHANIAAMVSDPHVLKHPRKRLPKTSARASVAAIGKYESGVSTTSSSTTSGTTSLSGSTP